MSQKWSTDKDKTAHVSAAKSAAAVSALKDDLTSIKNTLLQGTSNGILAKSYLSKLGRFEIQSKYPTLVKDLQTIVALIYEITSRVQLSFTDISR